MCPVKRVGMVLVAVSALGAGPPALMATDRYVPNGGEFNYPTIRAAIEACVDNDRVIVQDRPEYYTGADNHDLDFGHKAITVRSASGRPDNCTIDCGRSGRGFWFHSGESATSIVQGFTIKNSYINPGYGGAILCENGSSPKIINCNFVDNWVQPNQDGDPTGGGAIACLSGQNAGSSPVIANCTFSGNQALRTWQAQYYYWVNAPGGAIYCAPAPDTYTYSNPVIVNCTFTDNTATAEGGAIYLNASNPILLRCQIKRNPSLIVGWGRAVYWTASSPTIVNCLIAENNDWYDDVNDLQYYGGGIVCDYGSNAILTNCTIGDNEAVLGLFGNYEGAGLLCSYSAPILTNCILWGNIDAHAPDPCPQIQVYGNPPDDDPIVRYCDVQGGWSNEDPNHDNIGDQPEDDPLFVEPSPPPPEPWNDRYYLSQEPIQQQNSPCLNTGMGLATDMGLGNATTRTDREAGDMDTVDRGYHHPLDCNDNGIPDPEEIADGSATDCNYNGVPDDPLCDTTPECQGAPTPAAYTLDADFDLGTLINVNHDPLHNQLQRNVIAKPLPYVWVPCSWRPTIMRVLTETAPGLGTKGDILGEYLTTPGNSIPSPSRTAVDLDGNVWVANRSDNDDNTGSVTRIGIVIGGVRCDATGTPNEFGEYIKPSPSRPFKYNTCIDRNGDGLIHTSRGTVDWTEEIPPRPILHTLPWPGAVFSATSSDDECVLNHLRVNSMGTRHVSVDRNNHLWVSGTGTSGVFDVIDGDNILATLTHGDPAAGYGGVLDCNNVIWSAGGGFSSQVLRWPVTLDPPGGGQALGVDSEKGYGLGVDFDANIWNSRWTDRLVHEIRPDGTSVGNFPAGGWPGTGGWLRGVAVSVDPTTFASNIWVANSGNTDPQDEGEFRGHWVTRLDELGGDVRTVELGADDGRGPTGVAVDAAGKVWTTCYESSSLKCIDPATYAVDPDHGTVLLPAGAGPYSYSDMTGQVTLHTTATGTWNVIHDGGKFGTEWHVVAWNREAGCVCPWPENLTVAVRAADFQTALTSQDFVDVYDGVWFGPPPPAKLVQGRYLEIRVRFVGSCPGTPAFVSPILCDLRANNGLADCNCDGVVDFGDIDPFVLALTATPPDYLEYYAQFPNCKISTADCNCDGQVNFADVDPFVACLETGGCGCPG